MPFYFFNNIKKYFISADEFKEECQTIDETLERVTCEVIENTHIPQSPKPADNPIEISSQDETLIEIPSQEDGPIDVQDGKQQEIENNLQETDVITKETEQKEPELVKNAVESSREETAEMTVESISNNIDKGIEQIQQHEQLQETNAQVSTQLPEASSRVPDSTRLSTNSREIEQHQPEIRVMTEETKQREPELVKNVVESSREETTEMTEECISNNRDKGNEQIQQHEQPQEKNAQVSTSYLKHQTENQIQHISTQTLKKLSNRNQNSML